MRRLLLLTLLSTACTQAPDPITLARPSGPADAAVAPDGRARDAPDRPDASMPPRADAGPGPDAAEPATDAGPASCGSLSAPCGADGCCLEGYCDTSPFSPTTMTCAPLKSDGEVCDFDAACTSGLCSGRTCAPPTCAPVGTSCFGVDTPCCPGLACDLPSDTYGPGQCAQLKSFGEPCSNDVVCISGHCAVGACGEPRPLAGATFTRVFEEVLLRNGCSSPACHGQGAGAAAGELDLTTPDAAYAALLRTPARTLACASQVRVVPGDARSSLLWQKIAPGVSACGAKMPPAVGAVSPAAAALVEAWITSGAPR